MLASSLSIKIAHTEVTLRLPLAENKKIQGWRVIK